MYQDYLDKVIKIAEVKYDVEEDVTRNYEEVIAGCYTRNYTPRRTVEEIIDLLYALG